MSHLIQLKWKKTLYLALYNELFINGQRDIGNSNSVELFDRNRAYAALSSHHH